MTWLDRGLVVSNSGFATLLSHFQGAILTKFYDYAIWLGLTLKLLSTKIKIQEKKKIIL